MSHCGSSKQQGQESLCGMPSGPPHVLQGWMSSRSHALQSWQLHRGTVTMSKVLTLILRTGLFGVRLQSSQVQVELMREVTMVCLLAVEPPACADDSPRLVRMEAVVRRRAPVARTRR